VADHWFGRGAVRASLEHDSSIVRRCVWQRVWRARESRPSASASTTSSSSAYHVSGPPRAPTSSYMRLNIDAARHITYTRTYVCAYGCEGLRSGGTGRAELHWQTLSGSRRYSADPLVVDEWSEHREQRLRVQVPIGKTQRAADLKHAGSRRRRQSYRYHLDSCTWPDRSPGTPLPGTSWQTLTRCLDILS
jgi:hypothetical protein